MIQKVKSKIYCGTLDAYTRGFNDKIENELGIKLYKVELSKYRDLVPAFENLLSRQEHIRANKFHFTKDRNRFIICRTLSKFLLTEQTGLEIEKVFLDELPNKKPYLPSHPSVFFNVSHTEKYALIAIGDAILGVDIEQVNKDYDFMESLPHIFSEEEIDFVLKADNKAYLFYKFWTRKEAIVKATGKGIDDDFTKIPATDGLHHVNPKLIANIENLQVLSFELDEHHIGTLAYVGNTTNHGMLPLYNTPTSIQELTNLNKFI